MTLYALTKHLMDPRVRPQYGDVTVVYGAREPSLFLYKPDIKTWYDRDDITFFQAIDNPLEGWPYLTSYVPTVTKEIAPPSRNAVA